MKAYQFIKTITREEAVIITAENANDAEEQAKEMFEEGSYSEMNNTSTITCRELQQQPQTNN